MEDTNNQKNSGEGIFSDLLNESKISSLSFKEPEFTSFDTNSYVSQAITSAKQNDQPQRVIGKRANKPKKTQPPKTVNFYAPNQQQENRPETVEPAANPKTYVELLNTDFLTEEQPVILKEDEPKIEASEIVTAPEQNTGEMQNLLTELTAADAKGSPDAKFQPAQAEEIEEEEVVFDPDASLVDDYNYDEYEDRKSFLLSDWKKTEDYLAAQSRQGYHYTRHEGKKFYFVKGQPKNYYYRLLYFSSEPDQSQWDHWRDEGWVRMFNAPSRHKREAGWYVVRNEKPEGELFKEINNEEEKLRYFRKFTSSCRSTMFLLFVVMAASAISFILQLAFKGYLVFMAFSAALFLISLWMFLVYARMMAKSKKQAQLLSARIRLAENDPVYQAVRYPNRSDEQLESDWNTLDKQDSDK